MKNICSWTVILALAASANINAAEYCELNTSPLKQRVKLKNDPNYFISADPSGRYTAVIDESRDNILVDMSDGSVHDVPGGVDPVFTPDGKFLTLPGGKFIEMAEIQNQIDRNRPADNVEPAVNAHQNGVYQSIGILPGSTEKKKTYRYMN